jgi:predicted DNA-binding transcriptional regulator AlpA
MLDRQTHHSAQLSAEFLSEVQVADLLCQSVRTIQKWRVSGLGPPFYKFGRSVRYNRSDLVDWIETRRKAHTTQ